MTTAFNAQLKHCALSVLLFAGVAFAQESPSLQDLMRDFRQLKLQVLQQGLDLQAAKIARLERELTDLQRSEKYADEQSREINQHLVNITQSAPVQSDHAVDMETARANGYVLLGNVQESQRTLWAQVAERETDLRREKARLDQMHGSLQTELKLEKKPVQ